MSSLADKIVQKLMLRASDCNDWFLELADMSKTYIMSTELASYVGMTVDLNNIDKSYPCLSKLIDYCCDLDVSRNLTEGECRLFIALLYYSIKKPYYYYIDINKSTCLQLLGQIEKYVKRGERFDFDLCDKDGWNFFHHLCWWSDLEILEVFLRVVKCHSKDVINLNAETNDNKPGIFIACSNLMGENIQYIKICIESGLIDISDGRIYFAAINSGNRELCEYLYTVYPIDPNHCSAKGLSLLERAIVSGKLPTFEWLLSLPGLDINSVLIENKTPLMIALEEKQLEMCKKIIVHPEFNLLPTGCDPELVTALDYVKDPSVYELVPILLSKLRELSDNKYYQEIIKKQIDRSMYDKSKVLIEFLMSSEFPIIFNNGDFEVSV